MLKLKVPFPFSFSSTFKPLHQTGPNTIKMSTSTTTLQPIIIEHVVLFKVKPEADPTQMLTSLNSLSSLPQVLHLSAGPILHTRSSPFPFTHILHSRYSSKQHLSSYSSHPDHLSVVSTHVIPSCDDVMAVDWVSEDVSLTPKISSGEAIRVSFIKLKDGSEEAKGEVLTVIKGIKGKFPEEIRHVSCGENFSPARAKGYSLASLAVFRGVEEMERVDGKEEVVEAEKQKVREHLDSVIVFDYVIP